MRVIGIDPSLTSTGVAWIEEDPALRRAHAFHVPTAGRRRDSIADRADRIGYIVSSIRGTFDDAVLAVIEAPSFGSVGGSAWDRAGLWHRIVDVLNRGEVPVAEVAPATRAKWATGHGRADKATVTAVMRGSWEMNLANDDEADALALATMGAQHLEWDVPTYPHQAACLGSVSWPVDLDGLVIA